MERVGWRVERIRWASGERNGVRRPMIDLVGSVSVASDTQRNESEQRKRRREAHVQFMIEDERQETNQCL